MICRQVLLRCLPKFRHQVGSTNSMWICQMDNEVCLHNLSGHSLPGRCGDIGNGWSTTKFLVLETLYDIKGILTLAIGEMSSWKQLSGKMKFHLLMEKDGTE